MATENEVIVGASRKALVLEAVDEFGAPINVSGGAFRLQGASPDIVTTIDQAGTLTDPQAGVVTWTGIGGYVTTGNMGAKTEATFNCRIKWTDGGSLVDYSPEFQLVYRLPPI